MKSILLSVRPEWVAKILNGEKTIEIRKTAPKCDLPIDVYVYCTEPHAEEALSLFVADVRPYVGGQAAEFIERKRVDNPGMRWSICNGKVVAKFTLREVESIYITDKLHCRCEEHEWQVETPSLSPEKLCESSCLTEEEIWDYLTNGNGFAWHITDLQIFDEPMELRELYLASEVEKHRREMRECGINESRHPYLPYLPDAQVRRAPESWCYVEAKE